MPRVFISYARDTPEHEAAILALSNRLRENHVDCNIDQYIQSPPRGWATWCAKEIKAAKFVLVICTETYLRRLDGKKTGKRGRGAIWEGALITQEIYNAQSKNEKFIPVLLPGSDDKFIPLFLAGTTRYHLAEEDGYERLLRRLTDQPLIIKPELGEPITLPALSPQTTRIAPKQNAESGKTGSLISIPYSRNLFFTGREELLQRVDHTLQSTGAAAISGMAGQGKTQAALEYAYRHKDDYSCILWTRANSREALVSAFASIARGLHLPDISGPKQMVAVGAAGIARISRSPDDSPESAAVSAVRTWLETHHHWLLIVDNVDEIALLREFVPFVPNGAVLFTTVLASTGGIAERIPIQDMQIDEGALLLLRRTNRISRTALLDEASDEDRKFARSISAELGGLPLAIDHAAAYIEETVQSLKEYLHLYRRQGAKLRASAGDTAAEHAPISVTFSIAFQKTAQANERSAAMIQLASFLAPSPIPEHIFIEGAAELGERFASYADKAFEFSQVIRHAVRFSLMQRNPENCTVIVHRLVQAALQDTLDDEERRRWAERAVRLIHRAAGSSDFENPPRWEGLLPHVQVSAALIKEYHFHSPEAAALLARTARFCFTRALLTEASSLAAQALQIREQIYGPASLLTAESLDDLGLIYDFECKFDQAEPLFKRALDIHSQSVEKDELALATLLNDMGNSYYAQSRYDEAEIIYKQSVEIRERLLPLDSRDRVTSLYNLARLYETRGDYSEAEKLYTQSLQIREKVLGPDHRDVAISLSNLAHLHSLENRDEQAFSLYERALRIRERNFGRRHPDVAMSLNALANLYFKRYEDDTAERYYREAIDIWEEKVGKDHPATATGLANLGYLYKTKGKYAEAEKLYRTALEICERSPGPNSLKTAVNLEYLANLLVDRHRAREAEPLFIRARDIRERSLSPKHLSIVANRNNLAGAYYDLGEYAKAEALYQEALQIQEAILGPAHLDLALTLNNLAGAYSALGRYSESENLHRRALAIRQQHRAENHPHVALSMTNLAAALCAQAKYTEAEALAKRALDLRRSASKPQSSDIAESLVLLGRIQTGAGNDAVAEQCFAEVLNMDPITLNDPLKTADALIGLGRLYTKQRRFAPAEDAMTKALDIREKQLGPHHPETASDALALAQLRLAEGRLHQAEALFQRAASALNGLPAHHPDVIASTNGLREIQSRG